MATWNEHRSAELARAGVVPVQTVHVSGATFQLSKPFAFDASHQVAVAWVRVMDEKAIRVFYRSNSQCTWRMCDALAAAHIGKGFHEFDKQVPIDVSVALLRSSDNVGELTPWFHVNRESPSQELLAQRLLELLTVNRDSGIASGQVMVFGNRYVTREYASMIPSVPRPLTVVNSRIKTATGGMVADPAATQLPPAERLPDFTKLVDTVAFNNPAFSTFAQCDGSLTGRVFLSQDEALKYLFIEDQRQRAMLACVEIVNAPICVLGLRTQYSDVEGMDTPLLEYGSQIPEEYGGRRKARYQLNWPWVRRLPIIAHYYRGIGREMPPGD